MKISREKTLERLEKGRKAQAEMRAKGIKIYKNPKEKHLEHDTRKTAIDAKCFDCMGGEAGWKEDVRNCTCGPDSQLPCSLYAWRPYQ